MDSPVVDLLLKRTARRSISTEPLTAAVVDELIEAARLTPSCYNKQPWRFLFLQGEEALEKGREALAEPNRAWAGRAPLLVVGYSQRESDCVLPDGRAYHEFDLGMSVMNLILAATHLGLVARPMAGFNPAGIKEAFGLEEADEPLVMVAIGGPSDDEEHLPDRLKGLADSPRERLLGGEIVRRL